MNDKNIIIGDGAVMPMSLSKALFWAGQSLHYFNVDKIGEFVSKTLNIVTSTEDRNEGIEKVKALYSEGDYSWFGSEDFKATRTSYDYDDIDKYDEVDYEMEADVTKEELDSAVSFTCWLYVMKQSGMLD